MDAGKYDWCELSAHSGTTEAHPLERCSQRSLLHTQTGNDKSEIVKLRLGV